MPDWAARRQRVNRRVVREFSEVGVFDPEDGGPTVDISGVFDDESLAVDVGQVVVSSSGPRFTALDDDLVAAGLAPKSKLTLRGVAYRVIDLQADGTGVTELALHKEPS